MDAALINIPHDVYVPAIDDLADDQAAAIAEANQPEPQADIERDAPKMPAAAVDNPPDEEDAANAENNNPIDVDNWLPDNPTIYFVNLVDRTISNDPNTIRKSIWTPLLPCRLSRFGRILPTEGDGNCFWYAFIDGMRRLNRFTWFNFLGNPSAVVRPGYVGNFDGAIELRSHFHAWLFENKERVLHLGLPAFFLDGDGNPYFPAPNNDAAKSGHKFEPLGDFDWLMQKTFIQEVLSPLRSGNPVPLFFWADAGTTLPLLVLFTGTSAVLYFLDNVNGGRVYRTRLVEYREDGLVQVHHNLPGIVPPPRNAVVLHYDGRLHFEAIELHPDCEYSLSPQTRDMTEQEKSKFTRRVKRIHTNFLKSQPVDLLDSSDESDQDADVPAAPVNNTKAAERNATLHDAPENNTDKVKPEQKADADDGGGKMSALDLAIHNSLQDSKMRKD